MKQYLDGPLGVAPDLTHGCRKENCQDQKGTLGRRTLRTEVRAKFDKGPLSGNLMFLFRARTVRSILQDIQSERQCMTTINPQ